MDNIRDASKFLCDFISGYFSGEYTANDSQFFTEDAFVCDSSRTTDSFDKLGKSTVEVCDIQKKILTKSVYLFSLTIAVTKTFSISDNCSVSARVTSVVVADQDSFKISSFHVSIPSELLDYLDFLPVTEDFHNLPAIKAEFDRRTAKLEHESKIDPLTGILHRGAAKKMIESYLQNPHKNSVLMLFDLDNFKQINDTYGHQTGDDILIKFSTILKESFRSRDIVARLGGDEFIVFMKDASIEIVERRAKQICALVKNIPSELGFELSASIGIALPEKSDSVEFEQIYFQADKALYNAKQNGKDKYHFYA